MALRSGSHRATLVVGPDFCSHKVAISTSPASGSDSKSDELGALEKDTPVPSHAGTPALTESTLALKYSEADLMRILKIFSKTKSQKPKAKVLRERPLKAKVPDIYFGKSHIDCYHFCQQCNGHFETAGITGSNRTSFATLFFFGKINSWWINIRNNSGESPYFRKSLKSFLGRILETLGPL